MNIVYITNSNYFNLLYISLYSLIKNTNSQLNIYIIYYELKANYKKKLKELENNNIKIKLIKYKVKNKKLKINAHITKEAYLKLKINKIIRNKEKLLYIDCDTIINKDIKELYDLNVTDYALGVVLDRFVEKDYKEIIKIKNYFNSGILLINNKKYNKKYINKIIKYHDQDILNSTYKNDILIIKDKYNYQIDLRKKIKEDTNDKIIIHYIGPVKPVHQKENEYNYLFYKYAKKTPIYKNIINYQRKYKILKYPIKLKKKIKDFIYNNY